MTPLFLTVLGASLLGSVHCAGMCGGFVAFYAGSPGRGRRSPLVHLAYNGGRLLAYAALGAAAGALGAALDTTGGLLLGVQRVAALVSGVVIALWGAVTLLEARGVRMPRLGAPRLLRAPMGRALARLAGSSPTTRALVIGLLTGALPCGWLYAFVVTAAGTGSALAGAALMAVFWAGTLPVIVTLGIGVQALAGPLRRHLPTACAVAMIAVGVLAVSGRARGLDAPASPPAPAAPSATVPAAGHHHAPR